MYRLPCCVGFNLLCGACRKQQSVIEQLQARKGRLIVLCSEGDAGTMCPNGAAHVIEVPSVEDCIQPIINIIPLQVGHRVAVVLIVAACCCLVLLAAVIAVAVVAVAVVAVFHLSHCCRPV